MSNCEKGKQVPFSAAAMEAEQLRAQQAPVGATLLTQQDYVELLRTGFDDLFEVAVNPDGVMRHLRVEIDANKPVGVGIEGPSVVDGCIHMTLVRKPPASTIVERMTFIVYPEGDNEMRDESVSHR